MASLFKRADGSWSIQFDDREGRRRTISLGKVAKRTAETTRLRIEKLVEAQIADTAVDAETARCVAAASERLNGKLAIAGLIRAKPKATLGEYIDAYVAQQKANPRIQSTTVAASGATHKSLRAFFGEQKPLRSITRGDAQRWRVDASQGRAENTVRKWVSNAKKLFNSAIDDELIEANPFGRMPSQPVENREREYFVTADEAKLVLKACPSTEWRLIFGLARWGGLRCPSELLALRWEDIVWDRNRFVVNCVKTSHHEGRAFRVTPLFPELRPLLADAFDGAEEGAEYVITRTRDSASNLRTQLGRIVRRAGLAPWPKLFQNLRATRATELARDFPEYVAAAWLGHSVKIARNHYWQVTEEHFASASGEPLDASSSAAQGAALTANQESSVVNTEPKMGGFDRV